MNYWIGLSHTHTHTHIYIYIYGAQIPEMLGSFLNLNKMKNKIIPNHVSQSSTTKPRCCNSCSMWFCIVLLKYTRPSLKQRLSKGEHTLLDFAVILQLLTVKKYSKIPYI